MSTEIKNTLFSFVTMRAPELAEKKEKNLGFIERPVEMKGLFDNVATPSGLTKVEAKQLAISKQAIPVTADSTVLKTEQQIMALNFELFKFGIWIAKNKFSYTVVMLNKEVAKVSGITLSNEHISSLWDSLFYQVLTQESFYAKESIIQMLVAANYLKNKTAIASDNDQLLNATVVLPKSLFLDDNTSTINNIKTAIAPSKQTIRNSSDSMQKLFTRTNAELNNEQLSILKQELVVVKKRYNLERQAAYKEELSNYKLRVKPQLDQYNAEYKVAKSNWYHKRDRSMPYDAKNPFDQPEEVEFPDVEEFNFVFRKELDFGFLEANISSESMLMLENLLNINDDTSQIGRRSPGGNTNQVLVETFDGFDDLDTGIAGATQNNNETIAGATNVSTTYTATYNGTLIEGGIRGLVFEPFEFEIRPVSISSKKNIHFKLELPDISWEISSATITVASPEKTFTVNLADMTRFINHLTFRFMFKDELNSNLAGGLTSAQANSITEIRGEFNFLNNPKKIFLLKNFSFNAPSNTSYWGFLNDDLTANNPGGSNANNPGGSNGPSTVLPSFIPSGFGVKKIGIADYKKVEQSVQCYAEGEVAHIENIMARERRDKSTRRLIKSENTQTDSTTSEKEQTTDTATTDRFEMQNEVSKVLQESKDFSASAFLNGSYGKVNFGGNVNFASHSSKEENTRQAITQAKEVTQKASERVSEKVFKERVVKVIEEFEETNVHEFDNRKGDKHIVGVYRWVDKVYKNQIYNYGKRLMFEFMIPEPAKLHNLGMKALIASSPEKFIAVPIDPRTAKDQKLENYAQLDDVKLKFWTGYYNVDFDACPDEKKVSGWQYSFADEPKDAMSNSKDVSMDIPEGYLATGFRYAFEGKAFNGNNWGITVGDQIVNSSTNVNTSIKSISGFSEKLPIGIYCDRYYAGTVAISIYMDRTPTLLKKWQQKTFNAIINKYEEALETYNKKVQDAKDEMVAQRTLNPNYHRQIENLILRKNCISYLIDQNQNAKNTYGKTFSNNLDTFGSYEVNLSKNLDDYAAFVKFIEEAFEWDIMSYNFYPFYWGNRNDWQKKYEVENDDPLFRSFLQSGMARTIVTVRPGFENAVNWYMQTGQIWNGGSVPVIEDPLYMSIVDELKKPAGAKEGKAWLTRVPTSLTILQASSIGLVVDKALPCNCDDKEGFENPEELPCGDNFKMNNNLINNPTGTAKLFGRIDGGAGLKTQIVLKLDENTIQDTTTTDEKGQWEMRNLPSGTFILNLDATRLIPSTGYTVSGGTVEREVSLSNDGALEVNLSIKK